MNPCPVCGRAIPEDAPGGLCPYCLLQGVLERPEGFTQDSSFDRDVNQLLANLAARFYTIPEERISEAIARVKAEPKHGLLEVLEAMGYLRPDQREHLENLAVQLLDYCEGDAGKALELFAGKAPATKRPTDREPISEGATRLGLPASVQDVNDEERVPHSEEPGRYTRSRLYSSGGMGHVYVVHDEFLNRDIALKELLPGDWESTTRKGSPVRMAGARAVRFLREAKLTGQLEHPSIVPVYELGQRRDGTPYYTMKLVRGKTLAQALKDCDSLKARLRLLPHFVDLCQAVAYAHSRGVIHRDIKPTNVMIGAFGETVVIDWGLAKVVDKEDAVAEELTKSIEKFRRSGVKSDELTQEGDLLGTPTYMAPEQARGDVDAVDTRSDVFALGTVLYEILTGRTPFGGTDTKELLENIELRDPEPIGSLEPEAPPELASICMKALAKGKADRFQTPSLLANEIQRFETGALVGAYSYSLAELMARFYRRHRVAVNTAATAAVALLVVAVYSYIRVAEARDVAVVARDRAEHEAYVAQLNLASSHIGAGDYPLANRVLWETEESLRGWAWGYLLGQCNLELRTLDGHTNALSAAAFDTESRRVATASFDGTARVWSVEDGEVIATYEGHDGSVYDVAFSPDGRTVATASSDGTARLWSPETGDTVLLLQGHERTVRSVAFDPTGTRLVTASEDGTVRVWDTSSGGTVAELPVGVIVRTAAFDGTGRWVVAAADDNAVRVWSTEDWSERHQFPGEYFAVDASGERIAVADGPAARVYDLESATALRAVSTGGDPITDVAFGPDGTTLLTAGLEGVATRWDIVTGEPIARYEHGPALIAARFSPDGSRLLTASRQGGLKLWQAAVGEPEIEYYGHFDRANGIYRVSFSPDGRYVLTASSSGRAKIWDALNSRNTLRASPHDHAVYRGAFFPNDDRILTLSWDGTAAILDAKTGEASRYLLAFGQRPQAAAVNGTGTRICAALDSFTPVVLDAENGTLVSMLSGHPAKVFDVAFDPRGDRIATACGDGTIRLWDVESGNLLDQFHAHDDVIHGVAFSPSGDRIATASFDGTAKIWDSADGRELTTLSGHDGDVMGVSFSPDGAEVVTASQDRTARVWDANSGALKLVLRGHGSRVNTAVYNPDGTRIVTASWGGTARVWDANTGEELARLDDGGDPVLSAAFSHDGRDVVGTTYRGRICVWHAAPWRPDALPGNAEESWEQRFARWKLARDPAPAAPVVDPVPVVAYTTRDTLTGALQRTVERLDASPTLPEPADLDAGLMSAGLGRVGMAEGDRIVAIDGEDVGGLSDLRERLAGLVASLQDAAAPAPVTLVERGGERIELRYRFVDVRAFDIRHVVARADVRDLLTPATKLDRAKKQAEATVVNQSRAYAERSGYTVGDSGPFDGLVIEYGLSPDLRALYPMLGLGPGDRLMQIDGEAVTGVEQFYSWLDRLAEAAGSDAAFESRLHVERGEFQAGDVEVVLE